MSGGTSEFVSVSAKEFDFETRLLGGTKDLNAGQVIDRVGVYMGFPFPAGAHIEAAALLNTKKIPKKRLSVDGLEFNLSGLENMAKKLYDETADSALTSAFVLDYILRSLSAVVEEYESLHGHKSFVFAGGVMCNSIIKRGLSSRFDAYFAEPAMSADNAVGIAALALRRYKTEKI